MRLRGIFSLVILLLTLTIAIPSFANSDISRALNPMGVGGAPKSQGTDKTPKLGNDPEAKARQQLRDKLIRVGGDLDNKEKSYSDSRTGGSKEFNANDGNSFLSNTTYHSYAWDYCLNWLKNKTNCKEWLHPYVSGHGAHGDKSPLEGAMFQLAKQGGTGQGGQFSIWEIESEGGFLKSGGRLDRERMTGWRLNEQARGAAKKIGNDTATRQIANTFVNGEAKDGSVLPTPEALRRIGGRLTKMVRNRQLDTIGGVRAAMPGIEVAQGEDIADCAAYSGAVQQNRSRDGSQSIDPQAKLDQRTLQASLKQRLERCMQAKQMSAYAANVRVVGNQLQSAGPKGEWIDSALARAQLASIDYTGIDVKSAVPMDGRIKLRDEYTKSEITIFDDGAKNAKKVSVSNADVLKAYNRNLASAGSALNSMVKRTGGNVQGNVAGLVTKWQIQPGTMNMVKLNDLTPEMRNEVGMTDTSNEPGDKLETTPAQLTIRVK